MIDINKKYTTRDGREVVIYAVYPEQEYGVHGAIKNDNGFYAYEAWNHAGTYSVIGDTTARDLIEVQEPPKEVEIWLNFYSSGAHYFHESLRSAIHWANDIPTKPIARKRITIQYREGEFDE